jgi:chlorobactene glucosyltransferase
MIANMFITASLFFLVSIGIAYWIHNQWQTAWVAGPDAKPHTREQVSVIVPARNEARNIRRCLESLCALDYPTFEILVFDDHSEDETAEIVAEFVRTDGRVRLIQGKGLPPGWAGKPHALWQAQAHAVGEWLCFIDADTFAQPELLSATLAFGEQIDADLISILTHQELESFWERVVLPLVFTAISVGFSPRKVNDPDRPDAIANGQYILIRREVYTAVGGHAAVRASVVEDLALARLVKGAGFRIAIADGRQLARTRMYTSLAEIWEGWTKNIYLGLEGRWALIFFGAFGTLLSAVLLPLWPLLAALWLSSGGGWQAWVVLGQAVLFWGYLLYQRRLAAQAFGVPGWYAVSLPLASAVLGGMIWTSAWRIITRRGVKWKGRNY